MLESNNSSQMLERNRNELVELKHVLEKDQLFFQEAQGDIGGINLQERPGGIVGESAPLLGQDEADEESFFPKAAASLGFVTGVVAAANFLSFERVLWRATRGNLFMKHSEMDDEVRDSVTGELVEKCVFIIFFQGSRVENKIRKICEAFKANLYPCPNDSQERATLLAEVTARLQDLDVVLARGAAVRRAILTRVGKEVTSWTEKLAKEKAIFNTMNMMDYDHGRKCLIATGWIATRDMQAAQQALRQGMQRTGSAVPSILSVVPTHETPPTYFRTNKFTEVFQDMVDAYGVAHYGEVNPATFAIATFPFLFAIMYGDVGHGIIMLLSVLPLIFAENKLRDAAASNEIFGMMFGARYLLLMMALGAIYTGFLYNEFYSIPMNIFGSSWSHDNCAQVYGGYGFVNQTGALCKLARTYPFGIDPAWQSAENALLFSNSLKMKMAVIIGVIHMSVGVFMHLLNGIHFRKWYNVFFEFVPQLLFLWCMFGYLVSIVVFKWVQDYGYYHEPAANATICGVANATRVPPLLISIMISMALPIFNPITCEQEAGMFGPVTATLQTALILIALICIPWMLLVKPILLWRDSKRGYQPVDEHHGGGGDDEHGEHAEFQFGEVFVHQMIHSIEFILGTVSNTASYLRLWALSLAHSELSIVFYEKALVGVGMSSGAGFKGALMFFVTWGIWAGVTIGVLVVMEALSAFLHALRLHWVEFQNKFYQGDGRKFVPFSFKNIVPITVQ